MPTLPSDITIERAVLAGIVPTYGAADVNGNLFANSGRTFLHVKNGAGAPITVTIASQDSCSEGYTHDVAVTVANASEKIIGPFPIKRFNTSAAKVSVTYSSATTITVAAIELP